MVRLKHEFQTSTRFTAFVTAKLRSSYEMCFGSKVIHIESRLIHNNEVMQSVLNVVLFFFQPTIVGYSSLDPDDNRMRHQMPTNSMSVTDERKNSDSFERNKSSTPQIDPILDPV